MGDIEPFRGHALVDMDQGLLDKQKEIQINEKKSIIDGLKIRLANLENIEAKKINLQLDILQREIAFLEAKQIK